MIRWNRKPAAAAVLTAALVAAGFFGAEKLTEAAESIAENNDEMQEEYREMMRLQQRKAYFIAEAEKRNLDYRNMLDTFRAEQDPERSFRFAADMEDQFGIDIVSFTSEDPQEICMLQMQDEENGSTMHLISRRTAFSISADYGSWMRFMRYICLESQNYSLSEFSCTRNPDTGEVSSEAVLIQYAICGDDGTK